MLFTRLLFLVLLSTAGFAQTPNVWTARGPEGGVVGKAVIDPQSPGTLYVNTGARLLKTADAAGTWSDVAAPAPPNPMILAVDPRNSSILYGANRSLFKSTDGGVSWSPLGGSWSCPCADLSLVIDSTNPSTLYAAYTADSVRGNGGVFKSTDGGATWNAAGAGLPVSQPGYFANGVAALAIDPKNPATLYAATGLSVSAGGGLFKSTDGAMSWSPVNSGLAGIVDAPVIDPRNSNSLYLAYPAADFKGPILKSADGGSTWVNTGFRGGNLVFDPQDSRSLYAVSSGGIVKSVNGGASWSVVLPGAPGGPGWWVAVTLGGEESRHEPPRRLGRSSTVYAGTGWRGIFKSSDGGSTWAAANSGLFADVFYTLAIDPRNPRALYAGVYSAGLLKSADGAASWSTTPIQSDFATVAFDPRYQGTVYASSGSGVAKSLDGGQTWLPLQAGLSGPIVIDMQNPDTVYVGWSKSSDAGASWVSLTQYNGELSDGALAIDPQIAGTIYSGSLGPAGDPESAPITSITSGVVKSVDGGRTWSGANTLWRSVAVSSITVDPTNSSVIYAQTGYLDCGWYDCAGFPGGAQAYTNSPEVQQAVGQFKSTDGGATWVKLDGVTLIAIDPRGTVYARTPAGVARSHDGGATWKALPTAGLISAIGLLAFDPQDPNHLFTGTSAGVFEITLALGND